MIKISMAFHQLISGTCDKEKKNKGDRKTEKGIRSNLIVFAESILPVMFTEGRPMSAINR